jgi:hypothetical protein
MVHSLSQRSRRAASEEAIAVTRLVLGLSAAVGGMAGGIGLLAGQPMGWLIVPAAILTTGLITGFARVAAWAGVVLWAGILPEAHAEAMLGPMLMALACVTIAIGPSRLLSFLRQDVHGRAVEAPADGAWIEEA